MGEIAVCTKDIKQKVIFSNKDDDDDKRSEMVF